MSLALRRMWIQITADKRRFGVLCAVLLVGLLLWARLIVVSNMPRTVVAEPRTPEVTENVAPRKKEAAVLHVAYDAQPSRDPFVISRQYFPRPTVIDDDPALAGKSPPLNAEDPDALEARTVARLQELVDRMKLEAVMTRASMAAINGKVYRLGDMVPAGPNSDVRFQLSEVRERSVILALEHRVFELKIAAPLSD